MQSLTTLPFMSPQSQGRRAFVGRTGLPVTSDISLAVSVALPRSDDHSSETDMPSNFSATSAACFLPSSSRGMSRYPLIFPSRESPVVELKGVCPCRTKNTVGLVP